MFLLFNKFSQLILWETYGGQSGEWRLKAWEAPVDFALSFLIVFIFAKYIGFIFSEKSKLHDYPDFFLVSIQRYYFLLWIDIAPCQRAKVLVVSIANDKVHSEECWNFAPRKPRENERANVFFRVRLAKTSNATTLNRKCNGCHFSKLSSQCCGIIFLLNNSKVVMIKISFTLISWLLLVTNR